MKVVRCGHKPMGGCKGKGRSGESSQKSRNMVITVKNESLFIKKNEKGKGYY